MLNIYFSTNINQFILPMSLEGIFNLTLINKLEKKNQS